MREKVTIIRIGGVAREDHWTSLLGAREGMMTSPALLGELLLHSAVKTQIFGSEHFHISCQPSRLTNDIPAICLVQLSAPSYCLH